MNATFRYVIAAALAAAVLVVLAATDFQILLIGGILPVVLGLMLLADTWHGELADCKETSARKRAADVPARTFRRYLVARTRRNWANVPMFRP